jgi:starvation-inducible DNA-binding protein
MKKNLTKTAKLTHTRNSLPEKVRMEVVSILQAKLADSIDLMMQAKQAHWNVKGPHFIALHELFDKVFHATETSVDLIAERIVQLGGIAKGTIRAASVGSTLPEYSLDITSGIKHVAELAHAISYFSELLRKDIALIAVLEDADTVDILTEISRAADVNLWFVEAHEQSEK